MHCLSSFNTAQAPPLVRHNYAKMNLIYDQPTKFEQTCKKSYPNQTLTKVGGI